MAQYRSQWTGEVIDNAVGKAKHITYLDVRNESAESAYAKAEAAQGIAELVAVYKSDDGSHQQYYYMPCVYRYNQGSEADYHFMANYSNNRIASVRLFNSWAGPMWSSFTISTVDSTPTEGSSNLVKSGGVKSAISKVAVRPNLLRNWCFVGGGSQQGGGQFPINQRGQTTYGVNQFCVDGWITGSISGTTSLLASGIRQSITSAVTGGSRGLWQQIDYQALRGKTVTASVLVVDTTISEASLYFGLRIQNGSTLQMLDTRVHAGLVTVTGIIPDDTTNLVYRIYPNYGVTSGNYYTIAAAKLELGDTQTLCHNEGTDVNPVWVLNEMPDYATELMRCISSTAYANDPYANKDYASALKVGSRIESGDDLDNYHYVYQAGTYAIASGVTNSPEAWSAMLVIPSPSGGCKQIAFGSAKIYLRAYGGNPLVWSAWKSITLS